MKKVELLKEGLPAVFKDMSKVKDLDYKTVTNPRDKTFITLKSLAHARKYQGFIWLLIMLLKNII